MSGSGRKRVSKWDSKQEDSQKEDDYVQKSASYYQEKDPEYAGGDLYPEGNGRNGSRRCVPDDDGLKSRQEPPRSRDSDEEGDASMSMMSYYDDTKKCRQPYWDRARTRTRRSGSRSNSRSHSRSPVRRGSYERHKTRARVSPQQGSGRDRDTKYYYTHKDSRREEYRSDYHRRETSDPMVRDRPEREYNSVSNVPCRYFAFGNCRNGTSCRFSHRHERKQMFSNNHNRCNERSDTTGKSNGSLIGDMEMSPDWNYGVKTVKKTLSEEHGFLKDTSAPAYERIGMFPTVTEASSTHHGFSNNIIANTAPPVQAFNQNIENHSAVPYQSTPLAVGGSQVLLPHLPGGLNSSNHENGNAQNTVSREELNHISNISASLAQFFGNGQLNPKQASLAQTDLLTNNSGVVPSVTALRINKSDCLVSLAGNPKPSSEASKETDVRQTEQEEKEDVENVVVVVEDEEEEEDDDDGNSKKEKDPKGMKAFKFALVEIVKELLKPAWKEGGMNKDAYKNIVKKAVEKVTGAIQTANIPQTQEKIDHYLSASKPKLTRLVQAYVSKVKKS